MGVPSRFYRPELDALRFFAFSCVFCDHVPIRAEWFRPIRDMGAFGMSIFFVLSSFLIVTLLLREKQDSGTVDVKAFAVRRILRIWPLYFLVLFLCYAIGRTWINARVSPHAVAAFTLLAGNLYVLNHGWLPSPLNPLWSISVEEQFYVGIPLSARLGSRRVLLWIFVATIILAYGVLTWLRLSRAAPTPRVWTNSFVQFQFFAAGGLLALYFSLPRAPLRRRMRIAFGMGGILLWWIAAVRCGITTLTPIGDRRLLLGYAFLLLGTVSIFTAILDIGGRLPDAIIYLGKISYGLYAFHQIFFWVVFDNLRLWPGLRPLAEHKLFAVLVVLMATVGTAALSYEYFERPILKLKGRFETVATRPL